MQCVNPGISFGQRKSPVSFYFTAIHNEKVIFVGTFVDVFKIKLSEVLLLFIVIIAVIVDSGGYWWYTAII